MSIDFITIKTLTKCIFCTIFCSTSDLFLIYRKNCNFDKIRPYELFVYDIISYS